MDHGRITVRSLDLMTILSGNPVFRDTREESFS